MQAKPMEALYFTMDYYCKSNWYAEVVQAVEQIHFNTKIPKSVSTFSLPFAVGSRLI